MDKKYITFYKKFILQTKTLNDSRVVLNSALKRKNYGRFGINWIYFCDDCDSNCYRKNNIKLQKIMHQTNPLNHCRVDLNREL